MSLGNDPSLWASREGTRDPDGCPRAASLTRAGPPEGPSISWHPCLAHVTVLLSSGPRSLCRDSGPVRKGAGLRHLGAHAWPMALSGSGVPLWVRHPIRTEEWTE